MHRQNNVLFKYYKRKKVGAGSMTCTGSTWSTKKLKGSKISRIYETVGGLER